MKNRLFVHLFLVLLAFCCATAVRAQDVASLTGEVTDTSGAVIPGAQVELVNTATSATYTAVTNGSGSYTLSNLPPGPGYKATFKASGFRPEAITGIYLNVDT